MGGQDFAREIPVDFPESESQHDVLASLWARTRIDDLMARDFNGMQRGNMQKDLQETITQLGLEYRLMTQFTSFVAVEEMIVTDGGQPRRIDVPVEVPEGVNRESVEGEQPTASPTGLFTIYSSSGFGVRSRGGSVGAVKRRASPNAPPPNASPVVTVTAESEDSSSSLNTATTPEEKRRQELRTKLHPSVFAVIERLQKKDPKAGPDEALFVLDNKAEIQIWLTDKSPESLAKLKELGFEVVLDPKSSKLVIGKLPIANLEKLAALKFVRYVAPQVSN
jgi:Ca-activated chloride channel family protein